MNRYTRALFRKVLAHDVVHSVRDDRTKRLLETIGLRAWNTGCPTLWALTPEHCARIPRSKSPAVVFTLTSYQPDRTNDAAMVGILREHYRRICFWPQGVDDLAYLRSLSDMSGIEIVPPNVDAYSAVLETGVDYVGNRLHGGIFALQHGCRAIIVSIDYRAREMGKDYSLTLVERPDIAAELPGMIEDSWETRLDGLDFALIDRWKAQFNVGS
ncbi:polysaccharide pyruvyl transferase family protein [Actinomyces ruminis]|uniref:polysaccharide pyruvyl transferase family protein n=1 Tax=Actinomyces ruminis TaxID=1937003 RepID=UPI00211F068D|nr:polysaccharide pyruvyl transferase family protein [Actinomyces ruminis]